LAISVFFKNVHGKGATLHFFHPKLGPFYPAKITPKIHLADPNPFSPPPQSFNLTASSIVNGLNGRVWASGVFHKN
jgi:hypothetical protein